MTETKRLYLIRHCTATGQGEDAPLSEQGFGEAKRLAEFLLTMGGIQRCISSPYLRAQQTIAPFATQANLVTELDPRLGERVLANGHLPDWLDKLKATFEDLDLAYHGGESSRQAMHRGIAAIQDALSSSQPTAVVSHGNLCALILMSLDDRFGFETWRTMTNPDVFLLSQAETGWTVKRIWTEMM